MAAQQLAVPATAIEGAVAARSISSRKDERVAAEAAYGKPAARQGRHRHWPTSRRRCSPARSSPTRRASPCLSKASEEIGWNLPLATIAKIWRAGCIIRSRFLDQMSAAYAKGEATNLLMVPDFVAIMKDANKSLRKVVAAAALGEFPMICLSASLAYFDSYRQARGTANLTQGQRDFFGAHGFELTDRRASSTNLAQHAGKRTDRKSQRHRRSR